MYGAFKAASRARAAGIREAGFYKAERIITTPQGAEVARRRRRQDADQSVRQQLSRPRPRPERRTPPRKTGLERWGYGMASVRFICGTQNIHKQLEDAALGMAAAPRTRSSIPPASTPMAACSKPCSAPRTRSSPTSSTTPRSSTASASARRSATATSNDDMADLEAQLKAADAAGARFKLIATDGVFSMDGVIAPLDRICDLAEQLRRAGPCRRQPRRPASSAHAAAARPSIAAASTASTSSPAPSARRSAARSAASPAASKEIVELLRQRSRPYLFSNTVPPRDGRRRSQGGRDLRPPATICARDCATTCASSARASTEAGFDLLPGEHPIIPVMLYDAPLRGEARRGAARGAAST